MQLSAESCLQPWTSPVTQTPVLARGQFCLPEEEAHGISPELTFLPHTCRPVPPPGPPFPMRRRSPRAETWQGLQLPPTLTLHIHTPPVSSHRSFSCLRPVSSTPALLSLSHLNHLSSLLSGDVTTASHQPPTSHQSLRAAPCRRSAHPDISAPGISAHQPIRWLSRSVSHPCAPPLPPASQPRTTAALPTPCYWNDPFAGQPLAVSSLRAGAWLSQGAICRCPAREKYHLRRMLTDLPIMSKAALPSLLKPNNLKRSAVLPVLG